MKNFKIIFFILAISFILNSCGTVKEAFDPQRKNSSDGVTKNKLFILIGFWKFRIILTTLSDVIIQSRDGDVSRNIPIRGCKD